MPHRNSVDMTGHIRVLRQGVWHYDGSVELPVRVVALDWEWMREPGETEPPALDADGWSYYVQFGLLERNPAHVSPEVQGEFTPTARLLALDSYQPPRDGSLSVDEAVAAAERLAPGIRWANDGGTAA